MKLVCAIFATSLFALLLSSAPVGAQDVPKDYQEVLAFLSRSGDFKAKVLKINVPRNDLKVTIAGQSTPTPFGFGGWVAMTKGDTGAEVPTVCAVPLVSETLHQPVPERSDTGAVDTGARRTGREGVPRQ